MFFDKIHADFIVFTRISLRRGRRGGKCNVVHVGVGVGVGVGVAGETLPAALVLDSGLPVCYIS